MNVNNPMSCVFIVLLGFFFGADGADDSDPREYLDHVMKSTNMSCLTPEGALSGECDFLSANMYARSLFGMAVFSCCLFLRCFAELLCYR